jgi:AcrR family transcriptional regulator
MSSESSARDRILSAAMEAFMEHGFAHATTLDIATRARVSKRELYALVGNKEQMLAACVAARGSRMRLPEGFPPPTDRASLKAALRQYAATLLRELLDPDVLAVFRLGIAEAKRSPAIAHSIDKLGRQPSRAALMGLLSQARASRLLAGEDLEEMASRFRALLAGDIMVWILLGIEKVPSAKELDRRADDVATFFVATYGR